ncbi:hypothetical protein B0T26DRAFT_669499 [Lasiosphaeria miniovina]|uniref:Uncharacterized protein n=1 Tax=Lasiosphaeria miniovina TaxID=1954250 RepID=A0AA40BF24_9PEZI|nr:uncharacterized protein B0T26DRAFT_669499 [Lasiosphaeria miniovina]KAK0733047.1 hypothetical protein B0T26DRAFT_669499 [Lasiosphaeria miniovina]
MTQGPHFPLRASSPGAPDDKGRNARASPQRKGEATKQPARIENEELKREGCHCCKSGCGQAVALLLAVIRLVVGLVAIFSVLLGILSVLLGVLSVLMAWALVVSVWRWDGSLQGMAELIWSIWGY